MTPKIGHQQEKVEKHCPKNHWESIIKINPNDNKFQ